MLAVWVCRNCRQLVSLCRTGAGGIRWRFRIHRIVRGADAMAECEQLALEPYVSPARVLPRHPHHQGGEDVVTSGKIDNCQPGLFVVIASVIAVVATASKPPEPDLE
jgi:hypothetical protein